MRRRPGSIGAAIAVVVALSSGCSGSSALDFWSALRIEGSEAEHFDTIEAMAASSDLVVHGVLLDSTSIRMIQGDAAEDQVFMVQFKLQAERTGETVTVEFLTLETKREDISHLVSHLSDSLPTESVVAFLRHKAGEGPPGAELYRLVNSSGLWVEGDRGLRAPISGEEIAAFKDGGQYRNLDDMVAAAPRQ